MMKPFTDLVSETDAKKPGVAGLRVVWIADDMRTADRKPLASLQAWHRYEVKVKTEADLKLDAEFLDAERFAAGENAGFKLQFHGRAQIPDTSDAAQRAVKRVRSPAGQTGILTDLMRSRLNQWGETQEKKSSLLALLTRNQDGKANQERAKTHLIAALKDEGVDVGAASALSFVPWHAAEVNLDEPAGLSIKTDADPVVVTVQGLLDQSELLQASYYTSRTPRYSAGNEKGIKELAIEALRGSLDGVFDRKDWVTDRGKIDATAMAAVERVAARHGRKVVRLTLLANVGPAVAQAINFDFTEIYRITGVDRALKIQHRGFLQLKDDGAWQRSKHTDRRANDINALAKIFIRDESERQLQHRRYNEAVKLLVSTSDEKEIDTSEERQLNWDVQGKVNEQLHHYGYAAVQFTSIVQDLPERPLLRGLVIEVEPQTYELSVAGRSASLGFRGRIRLVDAELIIPYLASEANDASGLIELICERVRQTIKAYVAAIAPDEYIESNLADARNQAAQIKPQDDPRVPSSSPDDYINALDANTRVLAAWSNVPSEAHLLAQIKRVLAEDFGIDLNEEALRRGADPITTRVYALQSRSFQVEVEGQAESGNTGRRERVRLHVHGRIIEPSRHPAFKGIFSAKAVRPWEEHVANLSESIENCLKHLLSLLPYEFFLPRHFLKYVAPRCRLLIEGVVEEEQGLLFAIDESGLRCETVEDVLEDEGIAQLDEHIAMMREHQSNILKQAKDPDELETVAEEYKKYATKIAWLQDQRKQKLQESVQNRRGSGDITSQVLDDSIIEAVSRLVRSERIRARLLSPATPLRLNLSDSQGSETKADAVSIDRRGTDDSPTY